jgi:hypothetical protein
MKMIESNSNLEGQKKSVKKVKKKENEKKNDNDIIKFDREKPIKAIGGIIEEFNIFYEPIEFPYFLYNKEGEMGISKAKKGISPDSHFKKLIEKDYIIFDDKKFIFDETPKDPIWAVPTLDEAKDLIDGIYPIKSGKDIFLMIRDSLNVLYEVIDERDFSLISLGIIQSWLKHILDAVFYLGFEAKRGSGKTKFLEGIIPLSYHGYLAGDLTGSGIARLIEKYGLSIAIDEVDQKPDSTIDICRQGYRKGVPYIRCDPPNYEPKIFDVFGMKYFTFYKLADMALHQRTIIVQLKPTKDERISLINRYVTEFSKQLNTKIFFWYIRNCHRFSLLSLPSLPYFSLFLQENKNLKNDEKRLKLFNELTRTYDKEQKKFLEGLFGRNQELAINIILLAEILEYNELLNILKEKFTEKQELDSITESTAHREVLIEVLTEIYRESNLKNYILSKGGFGGCVYVPKKEVLREFQDRLETNRLSRVSIKTYDSLLLDLGFQDSLNISRQYFKNNNVLCLIYTQDIKKSLGIESD